MTAMISVRTAEAQDAIFSQHFANPLYLNPGMAGIDHCSRINISYRNQPFPALGTFSTYGFSADAPIDILSGGMGVSVIHDAQGGLLSHTMVGGVYAWHGSLSRTWHLSLGLEATYMNSFINQSNLIFPDQYSSTGTGNTTSGESFGNLGSHHDVGFSFGSVIYSEQLYAGLAVHHLNRPSWGIYNEQIVGEKYTLMAGYNYEPEGMKKRYDDEYVLSPNVIIQSQTGYFRFYYGMYFQANELVTGVWFRHSLQHPNTLIFMLGLKQVNYTISYSYDYSLSGFSGVGGGAHEIGVLLNFNCSEPKAAYRILNCPTF